MDVEEVFPITGRGVILTPEIPYEESLSFSSATVTLKRPDGSSIQAEASFHIPHLNFAKVEDMLTNLKREGKYACLLKDVEKEEVPIGTEVWLDAISQ